MNDRLIQDAMWAGDLEKLKALAPCECPPDDIKHDCRARVWNGCTGKERADKAWAEWYRQSRGMTESQFYNRDGE